MFTVDVKQQYNNKSAESRRAVASYWQKYVHEVPGNHLGGLSLPKKSVFWLSDRSNMTIDVYRGHKTTTQHVHSFIKLTML